MSSIFNMRLTEADKAALEIIKGKSGVSTAGVVRGLIHNAAANREAGRPAPEAVLKVIAKPKSEARVFVSRLNKGDYLKGGKAR